MRFPGLIPELPLLRRELIELSNRRRTYVLRFLGAMIILSVVLIVFSNQLAYLQVRRNSTGGFAAGSLFGTGRVLFTVIVKQLFYAVQILMPALTCGAITIEKERNTLGTLFVTRLSPMTIVIQKLGSRMVPMLTFLLLTFPVLAFVYSLGGVDTILLVSTLWLLVLECILFAAIGLFFSSWFSTTAMAFIWSYVVTGMLVMLSLYQFIPFLWTPSFIWRSAFGDSMVQMYFPNRGTGLVSMLLESAWQQIIAGSSAGSLLPGLATVACLSVPSLCLSGCLILLTRFFLFRRAFVTSSSVLLRVFRHVDSFFSRLNDRTTGGVLLVRDIDTLPTFDPVAWRERTRKSLGKARYLFRILVVLEGPVLFLCVLMFTFGNSMDYRAQGPMLYVLWGITSGILIMKASTMISTERTRETLEALLSTPMTAAEIVKQKIAGMSRLMIVLSVPILTVHFTRLLMHFDVTSLILRPAFYTTGVFIAYAAFSVISTFVLMHAVSWSAAFLGLGAASQSRSILRATTVMGILCVLSLTITAPEGPLLYHYFNRAVRTHFLDITGQDAAHTKGAVLAVAACILRPDGSLQANESLLVMARGSTENRYTFYQLLSLKPRWALTAAAVVMLAHLIFLFLLRMVTLRCAPRLLGRRDDDATEAANFRRTQHILPEHRECPA